MKKTFKKKLFLICISCLAIGQLANARELYSRAELIKFVNEVRNDIIDSENSVDGLKIIDYRVGQGVSIEIDFKQDYKVIFRPKNQKEKNLLIESSCSETMLYKEFKELLSGVEYIKYNVFNKDNSFETSYKIDYEACNSFDYRNIVNPNTGKLKRSYIQSKIIAYDLANLEEMQKKLAKDFISIRNVRLGDGSSIVYEYKMLRHVEPINFTSHLNKLYELYCNQTVIISKLPYLDYIEFKYFNNDDSYITSIIFDTQVCKLEE
jgi:hypothetical protein